MDYRTDSLEYTPVGASHSVNKDFIPVYIGKMYSGN